MSLMIVQLFQTETFKNIMVSTHLAIFVSGLSLRSLVFLTSNLPWRRSPSPAAIYNMVVLIIIIYFIHPNTPLHKQGLFKLSCNNLLWPTMVTAYIPPPSLPPMSHCQCFYHRFHPYPNVKTNLISKQ